MILKDSDIPEVGNKPDEGYRKAGSWEENGTAVSKMPPDETITENRTFTFTYDEKTEPAEVKTPPTALSLTYNGSARELVTAGTAENGTMQYALGDNDQTAPTSGWSEEISKGTDAKEYYVWYKAKGDADHKDSEERCVTAGISPKNVTITAKDQTIHEGESIQTGTDYAVLTDAAPGHSLSAVTLEAKDGKIEASGASIKDATGADVTANYNITYRPGTLTDRGKISVTVKFKVVNGEWNSGGFGDKEVTLTGYEGDTLKLSADQIPAVGARPNNMYKAGNWDVTPNTETGISKTTTYTYAYVLDQALETAKASAINAVNGVDPAKYVEEDRQKVIDAKTTALNAISAATTTDAVAAAITAFNDAIASCRIEPQPSPDPDEKITISVPPKSVKAKVKGKKLTVSWKKLNKKRKKDKELFKQIRSIDIQVSTDRQFREIVAERKLGKKKTNVTVKIKKKTTYYVRVRYVGDDGVSKWSDVKKVKKKK